MTPDLFMERLAGVRQRFIAKLNGRIALVESASPLLCGDGPDAVAAVATAHHQIHELCGLAPTVGFPATGRAARALEQIILEPFRAARALTKDEANRVAHALQGLKAAAQQDQDSMTK